MAYNVLIADDSQTTRRIIAKALRHAGVDVGEIKEAADGLEALELLKDSWVDLVFADLNMPRMSGVELVARMAENDLLTSIPVVIVSTEGRQDRIDALFAAGVAAYVRKPFSPEQLAQTVHELLASPAADPDVDAVAEAFYGAVEGFTMLVAEPLNQIPPAPPRVVIARMELTGSSVTTVAALAVPESACQLIGEAATGQDDVSDGPDAVLELLNVACGQLVDTLGGGPFTMNPPTADVTSGTGAWNEVSSMSRVLAFDLEGIPLLFGVTVSNRWCPECRHDASESS